MVEPASRSHGVRGLGDGPVGSKEFPRVDLASVLDFSSRGRKPKAQSEAAARRARKRPAVGRFWPPFALIEKEEP